MRELSNEEFQKKVSYPKEGNDLFFEVEEKSFWFCHRNNCILELLKRFPPRGIFYDIGGGNGCVSKMLENNGFQTVLVEPSKTGIVNAQKRGLKSVICARLGNMNSHKHSLPAIGLFDVLEHIENPTEFLKIISSLLIPDGMLYITVPAFKFLWSKDDVFAGHFQRYSLKSSKKILMENGYTIEYATYFFCILPLLIFLFRSLPYRLGLTKKSQRLDKEKVSRDHALMQKSGIWQKLIHKVFQWELMFIKGKKKIPFGSSCLIVVKFRET
ncbi:MAG TPA: class I SAM-dependent methyltransferase [Candidatus Kapabacteria bacterium]|nr:class I SAM-dependent methyltransferase [Candidatus Kapabacteria bacterium]